jgi:hypothetical protein
MRRSSHNGSVVLVALSCVTVLGIAMASFLSVSNQAMKLSNRTYAKSVSKQLAEMGLERALVSYNNNSFDSWTRPDTTSATTSFSISSDRYGSSGITAVVNVRVDHYLATKKATPWSVLTTYTANDFVWYQGVWYLCIATPPVAAPPDQRPSNTTYWKAAPETWNAQANYRIGNIVLSAGTAYRCVADNINTAPPNATYWTAYGIAAWDAGTAYTVDTVALSRGVAYRCIVAHTGQAPPNTNYWLSAPVIYAEGVATLPDSSATTIKTQLRAMLAPAPLFPNALGAQRVTNLTTTGTVDSYNQVLGDYNQTTAPFSVAVPNRGSSAVVAGGLTTSTAVAITRVRVNGYVAAPSSTTAPYNPRYTYNTTSGIITSIPAPTTPTPKIDLSRVSRSPYIPKFSIQSVASGSPTFNLLTVADLVGTTTNLPRGGIDTVNAADGKYYYYTDDSIVLDSGDTLNINGPVVIDIRPASSGDLDIQNTGIITIANNLTASLEIHFDDKLYIYSDNAAGGIDNQTKDPKRLILIGTNNNNASGYHYLRTSVNNTFYGVIYMPDAYLHVRNGTRTQTIYGAISAKTIYFDDSTTVHYDTSLRTATFTGVDAPYRLVEWRELTDPAEKITLP